MNTIRKAALTVAGLGIGAAGVVGISTAANADTPSTAPTAPTASASATPGSSTNTAAKESSPQQGDRADHEDAFASDLASKLGIDKAKVSAALEQIRAEHPRSHDQADGQRPGAPRDGQDAPAGAAPGAGQSNASSGQGQSSSAQQAPAAPSNNPSAAPSSASTPR